MLFILGCLSALVAMFLIMICIHAVKIERAIVDIVDTTESYVTKFYSEGGR
jgi:hypothetical protein